MARAASSHASGDSRTPAERYRIDRLRLRHLRLLECIQRTSSLRKAAERVGVSQPAASLLLREIESVFEAALVIRTSKGCHLSAVGGDVLDRLTIALASVDRALETARAHEAAPGLRLGCVQLAGATILPATLARLERRASAARVTIKEGRANELLRELARGTLDCVIGWVDQTTINALPVGQLRIRDLWRGRMQAVAAADHPLARKRNVTLSDLLACRWIVAQEGTRMHAAFMRLFAQAHVAAPAPAVECSAVHTTLNLVARTRMLAMAPDVVAATYARQGQVKVLRGAGLRMESSSVSLITRRDSESLPVLRAFRESLIASVEAEMMPSGSQLR
jgi:DNA-binding transcriptional LysR family regulator